MEKTVEKTEAKKDVYSRFIDIQSELFDVEALMKVTLEYCYEKEATVSSRCG